MKFLELSIVAVHESPWNPNDMDEAMRARLRASLRRYGLVENLVVRPAARDTYEVLSGNQRLKLLKEMGFSVVPCVVVDLDDAHARLLAQALNHIHGEDDLGLRAELLREVLPTVREEEVVALLPGTAASLRSLASMGQQTIADYLESWQQARSARLKHMQFQLTPKQLEVVEEAIARVLPQASRVQRDSPNRKGAALYLLCRYYLERETDDR